MLTLCLKTVHPFGSLAGSQELPDHHLHAEAMPISQQGYARDFSMLPLLPHSSLLLHLGAATVASLESKVHRQEVSLDLEESSSETSLGSNSRPSRSSAATEPAVNDGDTEHLYNSSDSCQSEAEFVEAPSTAAVRADCIGNQSTLGKVDPLDSPDASCSSAEQAVNGSHPADDADMVHLYPDYLLSSTGLKLLQLCMAMWARDPEARPSCQNILQQLAAL